MSDPRIPASLPALAPSRPPNPARLEAVRAAQRAFFDTALAAEMQAPAAQANVAPAVETPPAVSLEVRVASDPASPPSRPLRPGSLLDIRV